MNDPFIEPESATPLDEQDQEGLLRTDITTRAELNAAEGQNIAEATAWASSRRRTAAWLLTQRRLKELHRRMFIDVWAWAGTFRRREVVVGIDPSQITTRLEDLIRDVQAQIGDGVALAWPADDIAVRFHHRLVAIHPFRHGNGRHARLAADILVRSLDREPFTWGGAAGPALATSAALADVRARYLAALRAADNDANYGALLSFVRDPGR